jgi:hypothetical protein
MLAVFAALLLVLLKYQGSAQPYDRGPHLHGLWRGDVARSVSTHTRVQGRLVWALPRVPQ